MKAKPAKSMKLHKPANSKPAKTMKAKHDKSMKAKPATSMKAKPAKLSMNAMKAKPMNAMKAKSMNAMKAKPDKSKKTRLKLWNAGALSPNMNARLDPEKPTDEPTVKPQPQWKLLQPVSVGDIWYPAGVILDLDRILVPGCLDILRPTDRWVAIPLAVECSPHTGHPRWKCIVARNEDYKKEEEGEEEEGGLAVEWSPHTGHPRWKCIEYGSAASPYVDFDQKEEGEDYDVGGGHA